MPEESYQSSGAKAEEGLGGGLSDSVLGKAKGEVSRASNYVESYAKRGSDQKDSNATEEASNSLKK